MHEAGGFDKDGDDAAVMGDVVIREGASKAVFEPFPGGLVTADIEIPSFTGDVGEILGGIDADDARTRIQCGANGRRVGRADARIIFGRNRRSKLRANARRT